jgi:hypothetical protein
MAKKSNRPNRPSRPAPASPKAAAPAPTDVFNPDDPKAQALFKIRLKRWLCLALIFAFLPVCTALARYSIDLTAFAIFAMFVLGHVLYRWLNQSTCPNCGNAFFVKQNSDGKSVGSGLSFPPISRCQSCGQSLHG